MRWKNVPSNYKPDPYLNRPIKGVLFNTLCVLSKYEGEKHFCKRNGDIFHMYDEYSHHHFHKNTVDNKQTKLPLVGQLKFF